MKTLIPAWVNGTLAPVEKMLVHQKGLRHKAISVFVFCRGKVLLQQRAMSKYHSPGLWANTVCTHPNWGENSAAGAGRRLSEELNLAPLDLQPITQIEYRADVGNGLIEHEVVECFSAVCETFPDVNPNPDEVMDYTWMDPHILRQRMSTAPSLYTKWLQIYVQSHFDILFRKGCEMP